MMKYDELAENIIMRNGRSSEMKETKVVKSGGVSFCGLLAIAFIVLKLCGVISWSWWWVLAPLWIPTAAVLVILACFSIFVMLSIMLTR